MGFVMRTALVVLAAVCLAGCARTSTIPLAADTVAITSSAAPICGAAGAQSVAAKQAAVETIMRGYDRFVFVGGRYANNVGVVGYTPVIANTTGHAYSTGYGTAYGQSTTTYSGGNPIIAGTHDQGLIVKMFREGDPAGANAVPARASLGPKWKEAVESNSLTCM
jgi:hypothetical protein